MAGHLFLSSQAMPDAVQIAREFAKLNRSLQYTAEQELQLYQEALTVAFQKHDEVRITAEKEGERAKVDLLRRQKVLELERNLRAELQRKAVAERGLEIEKQRRDVLASTLVVRQAAEDQRKKNEATQKELDKPHPVAVEKPRPVDAPKKIQTQNQEQSSTKAKSAHTARPVESIVVDQGNSSVSTLSAKPGPSHHSSGLTYLGLPFPKTLTVELQKEYLEYIGILNALKTLRKVFIGQVITSPQYQQIKTQVGDDRRFIRKSVSQLTEDRAKNTEIMNAVLGKINKALESPFPKVSLSQFIPRIRGDAPQVSSLYIYLINIFSKAIFAQFLVDACSDTKKADVIGMFASQLLASIQARWQNKISFWPVLVCKFARSCPVLFGVYGPDKTTGGKMLLGWGKEDGKFVTDQRHAERMTGLSAGWASITLRDYSKAKAENPAPSWYFWRSVALILNVPATEITNAHYVVLKALIEHNEGKILKLFGDFGKMLLQQSVLEYPSNQRTQHTVPAQSLMLLQDVWQKDLKMQLSP